MDDVIILSSVCGKHFDESCRACKSAKESNDHRIAKPLPIDEGLVERLRLALAEHDCLASRPASLAKLSTVVGIEAADLRAAIEVMLGGR